jgi:hypothetical protein
MVGSNYNIILILIKQQNVWKQNVEEGNAQIIIHKNKEELLKKILQIGVLGM